MSTVALVGLLTRTEVTLMSPPNDTTVLPLAKCVLLPVIVTVRFSAWRALDGETCAIDAVPAVTEKNDPASSDDANCVAVVKVTVRDPIVANGLTVTLTVAVVALVTVSVLTVMPAPKSAVVVPFTNAVNSPVTATLSVWPCWPDVGLTSVRRGVPAITVKPLTIVAFSPPVVSVMDRRPVVAKLSSEMFTVAVVALVTVSRLTVMSPPNEAVVTPGTKSVPRPVTLMETSLWPCVALFGVIAANAAELALTANAFETASAPVVTVTVRPPVNAVGLIVMLAVAVVELLTVSVLTVMPWPKLTVDVPAMKWVFCPVSVTSSVVPC